MIMDFMKYDYELVYVPTNEDLFCIRIETSGTLRVELMHESMQF